NDFVDAIDEELKNPSDQRLFAIANALHKGYSVDRIWELTKIDRWFLNKLKNIVDLDKVLREYTPQTVPVTLLKAAKQLGFSDRQVGKALGTSELAARKLRTEAGVTPFVKQIDTVAAEFPCYTNYLYMTYNAVEHDVTFDTKGVMVLGSGVYRIGSSVEFDWCAVRCIRTLRQSGLKTIMVNYNPETVSTDYDEADRLYFENLTLERVLDIYDIERADGVIVSMGGQSPNNIALSLHRENVHILGTSPEMIDTAENRYKFSRMCDKIGVDQPQWKELTSHEEAESFCEKVGFPVLVRPSYVLSGAAMNVVYSRADLKSYLDLAAKVSREFPVVISKFIEEAKEIEMDAVAQDGKLVMHVITEHVENAGVHSGDATLVLPPQDLDPETVRKIELATRKIANALNVTGPCNIQFIAKNNEIKVIECNLRASRSFPFVSKVLGVDLIEMATKAMIGQPFEPYPATEARPGYVAVKVPQFSFSRLAGADPILGVEMASTGEVACFGHDKYEAYLKALISTGFVLPEKNILLSIGSFKEKQEFLPSVQKLHQMGYKLFATSGTADFIQEHGIPVKYLEDLEDDSNVPQQKLEYSLGQHLANNLIDLYINLPSKNRFRRPASYMSRGYRSRRMAVDFAVPLITNVKCAKLFVEALYSRKQMADEITANDCKSSHRTVVLPGLINVQTFFPEITRVESGAFVDITKAALAGGMTMLCNMPTGLAEEDGDDAVADGSTGHFVGYVKDKRSMGLAQSNCHNKAFCDYSLSVAATPENGTQLPSVVQDAISLYIGFGNGNSVAGAGGKVGRRGGSGMTYNISQLTGHFRSWPAELPIVANAKETDLASILLLANLYNRAVHVTNVMTKEDIQLIALSKEKKVQVTCDVCVHNLFVSTRDFPNADTDALGSPEDVQALWDHLNAIDCFSVGAVPYLIAKDCAPKESVVNPATGFEEALPLLITAVHEGRLTMEDLTARLYDNPRKLFDLPEQPDTYVEVEVDRRVTVPATGFENSQTGWSPLAGRVLKGCVHRVVLRGNTVYLDGAYFADSSTGRDVTGLVRIITKNLQIMHGPSVRRVSTATGAVEKEVVSHPVAGAAAGAGVGAGAGAAGAGPMSPRSRIFSTDGAATGVAAAAAAVAAVGAGATAAIRSPYLENATLPVGAGAVTTAATATMSNLLRGPSLSNVKDLAEELDHQDGATNQIVPRPSQQSLYLSSRPSDSLTAIIARSPFHRKHVVSVKQFTRQDVHLLFGVAQEMRTLVERRGGSVDLLKGKVMCSIFYEPSTRTSSSFETAMHRLGGSVVAIDSASSSVVKGETIPDTVRTLSSYGDVIVMRHPQQGSVALAAKYAPVPVINAGDGIGEHPTQAFLDTFTIREELGTVNGLTITMVGDLKNGRTVHSLVKLLALYDVKLVYVSPPSLRMPEEVIAEVRRIHPGIRQEEYSSLDEVIETTDVLYVTRIQKERFPTQAEYEAVAGSYVVTNKTLQKAKTHMIVMHPLPRVNEIDPEVDFDQRAAYFRQMRYGLYVRMALLALVCGRSA
ncbi:hypothetical protein HK102_000374, partial [Quaeritorhiza haematococci]